MPNEIDQILQRLPEPTREMAEGAWYNLPTDMRHELILTAGALTKLSNSNPLAANDLVTILKRQAGPAFAPISNIAIVGPVNVGKSTLYNSLLAGTGIKAEVSAMPGTTKETQTAAMGLFHMVDTPGLDSGRAGGEEERRIALRAASVSSFLIVVFDATRSVTASDREIYRELLLLGKPMLVVLNKIDAIKVNQRPIACQAAADVLGLPKEAIHCVSAEKGTGLQNLLLEVAATEPRLLGAMGKALRPLRTKLGWQAIRRAAIAACVIALAPLPVIDLVPLTALQCSLVLTLARIHDERMGVARATELMGSFGVGLAARTLAQQLWKLGGPPGWAISASIAGAATIAIGWGTMQWFQTGTKPSLKTIKKMTLALQATLVTVIKSFRRKTRPSRQLLREDLEKHLTRICCPELNDSLQSPAPPVGEPPQQSAKTPPTNSEPHS